MINQQLLAALYGEQSPYDSCDLSCVDNGYPHTNLCDDLVRTLFRQVAPSFVLECGSMLGGSAMRMAFLIKEQLSPANIVCVDPFTGDVNMWAWEQDLARQGEWRFLGLKNGRPTIYDRFLANCKSQGHDDIILPINTTSTVGMKLLKRLYDNKRITSLPNYLYLDSAHEPHETLLELYLGWNLLQEGGILFGDDWSWESVRNDVLRFAKDPEVHVDNVFLQKMASMLPSAIVHENILLYRGQWVMRKWYKV